MDCSPTPIAKAISRRRVKCFISQRTRVPLTTLRLSPATPPSGPRSSAGTAVPRCSSSRPSHALSTFEDLRGHPAQHECSRLASQNIPVGSSSNSAHAGSYCPAPANDLLQHPSAAPFRPCRSVTKHRDATNNRCLAAPVVSNTLASVQIPIAHPHRSPSTARSRGFLPWGLSDACPHTSPGVASFARTGRHPTTLNKTRR
jgi:hypothetical protein